MPRRRRLQTGPNVLDPQTGTVDALTRLWTLRALAAGGSKRWRNVRSLMRIDNDTLEVAGLPDPAESEKADARAFRALVDESIETLSQEEVPRSGTLEENVARFGHALELTQLECDIISLAIRTRTHRGLEGAFEGFDLSCARRVIHLVATTLDADVHAVREALSPKGTLASSGLVRVARDRSFGMGSPLDFMDDLDEILLAPYDSDDELLACFFQRAKPSTLQADDYPHASDHLDLLLRLFRGALKERAHGVNVLLFGPPGTGKTELARLVADSLNLPMYAVNVESQSGGHLSGERRCASFHLGQRVLGRQSRALMLFDEIEDAFPTGSQTLAGLFGRPSSAEKGWVNHILENNPVPSIWIANEVDQLDGAMVRRFDHVIELGRPPDSVRRRVVDHHLGDLPLDVTFKDRLARDDRAVPAVVEGLRRVALLGGTDSGLEARLHCALDKKLELLAGPDRTGIPRSPFNWDPRYLHTDVSIERLLGGLARTHAGRVLLYGLPGTGKTMLARQVADHLDAPLLIRRASQLLGKYVGESEKALAAMFREAKSTGAVVLLDEADSFLQDRRRADRSWEVTQVNELLTQMEVFEGVFVCSTNLIHDFDPAAFRRFDVKMELKPLTRPMRVTLVNEALTWLEADTLSAAAQDEVEQMSMLTPGDVAAVVRRMALVSASPTGEEVVAALKADRELQGQERARVGF